MVPFTEPVKSIVMLLPPPAKEATGKKMPNKKDTKNGKINRFIITPCRKYPVFL